MRIAVHPLLIVAACAALGIPAATVRAQVIGSAGITAGASRLGLEDWQSTSMFSSSLRIDTPSAWLSADGGIAMQGGGLQLQQASASGAMATPSWNGLRGTFDANAERVSLTPFSARGVATATAALSFRSGVSGGWAGLRSTGTSGTDSLPSAPLLVTGLWRQFGRLILDVSVNSQMARLGGRQPSTHQVTVHPTGRDSLFGGDTDYVTTVTDSGAPSQLSAWAETEAHAGWSYGRLALDGLVGVRPRVGSVAGATWANAYATLQLGHGLAVVGGAGTTRPQLDIALPSSRFMTIGARVSSTSLLRPAVPVQVSPSAASFTADRMSDGHYVVSIHVPKARTVELSGDFDRWVPLTLREVRPDVWEATLLVGPGTYHMNIRVDGDAWVTPPGLVALDDEFNGKVGVVVLR